MTPQQITEAQRLADRLDSSDPEFDDCSDAATLLRTLAAQAAQERPARVGLTEAEIEKLREDTFSTNNPFCPCDRKTMQKAVRAAERAHNIPAAQEGK